MAALASSLIRQKREVREPGGSRPVSAQRRVCPRGTKSLCQKQLLILLSKVRLCGGRPARPDRGPGECGWGGGLGARELEAGVTLKNNRAPSGQKGRGVPGVEEGVGQDRKVPAGPCLSFPFLLSITPDSRCFQG